jgi:hypothetical protein
MPWMPNDFGSYRFNHHITADLQKVAVLLNENSFNPPLKHMTDAAVALVKRLRIDPVELPHAR